MPPISRNDILQWVNDVIIRSYYDDDVILPKSVNLPVQMEKLKSFKLDKIEDAGRGIVYLLIFNLIYPNKIMLNKMKIKVNGEYEILQNFKILQAGMGKVGIKRDVDVSKLSKCRMSDNLEFLQWWFGVWLDKFEGIASGGSSGRKSSMGVSGVATATGSVSPQAQSPISSTSRRSVSGRRSVLNINSSVNGSSNSNPVKSASRLSSVSRLSSAPPAKITELKNKVSKLENELEDIKSILEGTKTEREFYYGKLQEIESLCQAITDGEYACDISQLMELIFKTLYSVDEGFRVFDEIELQDNSLLDVSTDESVFKDEETF